MGCTKNRSKISVKCITLLLFSFFILLPHQVWAALASQFSLSVGELYSDNIFFSKNKQSDFVTVFTPTLSLYYAPTGVAAPTLNLNISPSARIYADHSELNSFGFTDGGTIGGAYSYQYSPRLTFNLSESFQRQGQSRLNTGGGSTNQTPLTPTTPFSVATPLPANPSQNLHNFIGGDQLSNTFAFQGNLQVRPDLSFMGGYSNSFSKFISAGGTDLSQTFSARGVYNWKQEHNLHAGYSASIAQSRNGSNGLIHNFDFGDDYFTSQVYKIQLTPTLSLAGSTGLSINTSTSGPKVGNNSAVTVTKLWETASLSGGLRKGLLPSFFGASDTTSLFANFGIQLAERLSGSANTDFAYSDTGSVKFNTLQISAGLQYTFTSWLSSSLSYSYSRIDTTSGANQTDGLLSQGVVSGSNIFLNFTTRFDLWPNTGLARTQPFSSGSPVLRTPFPSTADPSSTSAPSSQPPSSGAN
jgi:opacity protein-like surface antigen